MGKRAVLGCVRLMALPGGDALRLGHLVPQEQGTNTGWGLRPHSITGEPLLSALLWWQQAPSLRDFLGEAWPSGGGIPGDAPSWGNWAAGRLPQSDQGNVVPLQMTLTLQSCTWHPGEGSRRNVLVVNHWPT